MSKKDQEGIPINITDVESMLSNPIYCLKEVEGWVIEGETMVTEEVWIICAEKAIKEMGAKKWLRHLLNNLKQKTL